MVKNYQTNKLNQDSTIQYVLKGLSEFEDKVLSL